MLCAPFMTIRDVTELLKVSKATVRTWTKNGELQAVKLERGLRIAKVDLERFVEARATMAKAEIDISSSSNAAKGDT